MAGQTIKLEDLKKIEQLPGYEAGLEAQAQAQEIQQGKEGSLLPAIGGITGGLILNRIPGASVLPKVLQPFYGSLVGSTIGTTAGTGLEQYLRSDFSPEQFKKELVTNAVFDIGGNLVFKAAGTAFKLGKEGVDWVRNKLGKENVTPEDVFNNLQGAQEFLSSSGVPGATITRGAISPLGAEIENATRGGFTGTRYITASNAVSRAVKEGLNSFTNSFKTSPFFKSALTTPSGVDEFGISIFPSASMASGNAFKEVHAAGEDYLKENLRPIYRELDNTNINVDMAGIKAKAKAELARLKGIPDADPKAVSLLTSIQNVPDSMSWSTAFDTISNFKGRLRDLKKAAEPSSKTEALYSSYINSFDSALDTSAQKLNSDAYKKYRTASDTYKTGMEALYSGTLEKALANGNNEAIAQALVNGETAVSDLYKVAGMIERESKGKITKGKILEDVRAGYSDYMFKSPDALIGWLNKFEKDPAFAKAQSDLFTKQQLTLLKNMGYAAKNGINDSSALGKIGYMQIGQGAALIGGIALALNPTLNVTDDTKDLVNKVGQTAFGVGTTFILTPKLIAKMMTNPATMDYLLKVTNPRTSNAVYGAATAKILDTLNKNGWIDNEYFNTIDAFMGTQGQKQGELPPLLPKTDTIRLDSLKNMEK